MDPHQNKLLLMDAPQGMIDTRSFRAVQVAQECEWTRNTKTRDPVSGMDRDNGPEELGTIFIYFENPTQVILSGLSDNCYEFYTGSDVQVGDKIDCLIVKRISKVLGVNLVVAE